MVSINCHFIFPTPYLCPSIEQLLETLNLLAVVRSPFLREDKGKPQVRDRHSLQETSFLPQSLHLARRCARLQNKPLNQQKPALRVARRVGQPILQAGKEESRGVRYHQHAQHHVVVVDQKHKLLLP